MITTIVLGSVTIKCNYVDTPQPSKIVRHIIPGRDGDVHQNMGKESINVELRGILDGSSKDTDRTTLIGYEGQKVTYNDGTNNFTMIVTRVHIPTVGGQPNSYNFEIRGYKYDQ